MERQNYYFQILADPNKQNNQPLQIGEALVFTVQRLENVKTGQLAAESPATALLVPTYRSSLGPYTHARGPVWIDGVHFLQGVAKYQTETESAELTPIGDLKVQN